MHYSYVFKLDRHVFVEPYPKTKPLLQPLRMSGDIL